MVKVKARAGGSATALKSGKKAKAAKAPAKGKLTVKVFKPSPDIAPGEHIRVVPLHTPKPIVALTDLVETRKRYREGADEDTDGSELFAGQPHAAPADALLTYRGGALIENCQVFTIFWGKKWGASAASTKMMSDLNRFFADILTSPLIDQLSEYNTGTHTIKHGSFIGTKVITTNAPAKSVTDSTIRKRLKSWIKSKLVPKNAKNTLYFIYLDPGIVSSMGGTKSCQSYCGYHDAVGSIYYAVMPYPSCTGCLGGLAAFDALTGTSSHELCEAITDPVPGAGWYDDDNGEIGDICAWNFKQVAGYTVQLEWSNQHKKCI